MPLPFIVWAAIAAGGAYVAWKNKDTIMETLNEVGKEIYAKEEKEVEQLLAMPVDQALKVIELNVGSKDIFQWGAFKNLLLKKSHESVQAKALLVKATEVWESANPELAKGN